MIMTPELITLLYTYIHGLQILLILRIPHNMTIKLPINFPTTHYTPTVFYYSIIIILMWPLMSPGTIYYIPIILLYIYIYIIIYIYSCLSLIGVLQVDHDRVATTGYVDRPLGKSWIPGSWLEAGCNSNQSNHLNSLPLLHETII